MEIFKVIFLDIDGVLASLEYLRTISALHIPNIDDYGYDFDPRCVRNLEYILKESPGVKIVLSSTWRNMGLANVKKMWKSRKLPGEVIDITPNFIRRKGITSRGMEIQAWLSQHSGVNRYIIVDDDCDILPEQTDVFIHTASSYGLCFEDCRKAIDLLNRGFCHDCMLWGDQVIRQAADNTTTAMCRHNNKLKPSNGVACTSYIHFPLVIEDADV